MYGTAVTLRLVRGSEVPSSTNTTNPRFGGSDWNFYRVPVSAFDLNMPNAHADSGNGPGSTFAVDFDDWHIIVVDAPALPTSKDQCKNGGWRRFGVFKNQGDCVSFVATRGKNPPAKKPG
jgi:hypothetical protein